MILQILKIWFSYNQGAIGNIKKHGSFRNVSRMKFFHQFLILMSEIWLLNYKFKSHGINYIKYQPWGAYYVIEVWMFDEELLNVDV